MKTHEDKVLLHSNYVYAETPPTQFADDGDSGTDHAVPLLQPVCSHGDQRVGDRAGEQQGVHCDHLQRRRETGQRETVRWERRSETVRGGGKRESAGEGVRGGAERESAKATALVL